MGEIIRMEEGRQTITTNDRNLVNDSGDPGIGARKSYKQGDEDPDEFDGFGLPRFFTVAAAQFAAERFQEITMDISDLETMEILECLQRLETDYSSKKAVVMLKCIFIITGQRDAVWNMDFVEGCSADVEKTCKVFLNTFLESNNIN